MATQILFDSASLNTDSRLFMLNPQKTIVASGLQPGDYITFEMVMLTAGEPSSVCGCYLRTMQPGQISSVTELMCPTCGSDAPQVVRLTERNPTVVLDAPQGVLLRAIYHGVGIDMKTVTVVASDTTTQDLTDSMRGCPPVCCEDFPQTWEETGERRCNDSTQTVEVRQESNCGNFRWVTDPTPPSNYWTETGVQRCNATTNTVENQQINPCGEERWINSGVPIDWQDSGEKRCNDSAQTTMVRQTNQCGQARWVADPNPPASYWTETGVQRCNTMTNTVENQQVNPCGGERWINTGVAITWTDTGTTRCNAATNTVENEQQNQCGQTRWFNTGVAIEWVDTGNTRCNSSTGYVENEQQNQCGQTLWNGTGEMVQWNETGVVLCNSDGVHTSVQQQNQCGQTRYIAGPNQSWTPTGTYDCVNYQRQQQQVNDCGKMRWVATGEQCGSSQNAIQSITPTPGNAITEGQQACWQIVLDSPVQGQPLTIAFNLSGSEQQAHNYPAPVLTIPAGQSSGQVCVQTTDDTVVEGDKQLCLQAIMSARITAVPAASCITVHDNDVAGPTDYNLTTNVNMVVEGGQVCYTATLNAPAIVAETINLTLTGAAVDNANPSINIPIGQSSGQVCVNTIDDGSVNGNRTLHAVGSNPFGGAQKTADVLVTDNDSAMLIDITSDHPVGVNPGETICYTVTLNSPAPAGGFNFTVTVSGDDTAGGQVCGSYDGSTSGPILALLPGNIAAGATQGTVCFDTTNHGSIVFTNVTSPGSQINEGQTLNVRISLDKAAPSGGVSGTVNYTGSEAIAHSASYPNNNFTVPAGQTYVDIPVPIVGNDGVDGNTSLYGNLTFSTAGWSPTVAQAGASVIDMDQTAPAGNNGSIYFTNTGALNQIQETQDLIVRITLGTAAPAGGVSGTVVWSNTEYDAHPGFYTPLAFTVPAGATYVDVNQNIIADVDQVNTVLTGTLNFSTGGWTPAAPTNASVTVIKHQGGGGGCYMSGTQMVMADGSVKSVNGLLPGDKMRGFSLPGIPAETVDGWDEWTTTSLDGLLMVEVEVLHNRVFNANEAIYINKSPLATTPDHPYFVKRGNVYAWIRAQNLALNDELVKADGTTERITTVDRRIGKFTFFALNVTAPDTIIARTTFGDVLGHNKICADCPD